MTEILSFNGSYADMEALERAVRLAVGPCTCGPLMRRGVGSQKCRACESHQETLAGLLAARDTKDRPTTDAWLAWRACPAILRLGEPTR